MNKKDKTPLRILQIGMSSSYGGTEVFLMNLYRSIDKSKFQFDFLNVYDEEIACQKEIEELGANVHNLHLRRREDGLRKYKKGINEFFHNNSFYAVHLNAQSLDNIDMLKYAKKVGIKKRVIYAHNSGFGFKPSLATRIIHRLNRLVIGKYATDFVAVGETASKWIYPFWIRKKVEIISNPIDSNKFAFNQKYREAIRRRYQINDRKVYGNVCRLDPQKNHQFLIDIFKEIHKIEPSSVLLIIGSGPLMGDLKRKVLNLGLNDYIFFLGIQSDVQKFYSAFDVFLYPTKFEGFGIVLAEAQASGLPILASNVIPKNAICTDLVQQYSLRKKASDWARCATELNATDVRLKYNDIVHRSFNIEESTGKIEKIYKAN